MGTPYPIPIGDEPPPLDADQEPARRPRTHPEGKTGKGRAGGRFRVLNDFVDFSLADLARRELTVWLILYRDTRDGTARTSYDDLARRAGMSRRHVGRALRSLEARGLVEVVHQGGFKKGMSRYRVLGLAGGT